MQKKAVFQARNLTKVYQVGETEVHALLGVDLDLYQGELVVLLGPSGSGNQHYSTFWVDLIYPRLAKSFTPIKDLG